MTTQKIKKCAKNTQKRINSLISSKILSKKIKKLTDDDKNIDEIDIKSIINPIKEFLESGGKRIRPFMMEISYKSLGGKKEIDYYFPIVEVIHNGTLAIDDIEDDSKTRRGKPCMHIKHGIDYAINAGNLMYYLPTHIIKKSKLSNIKKLKAYEIINQEMIKLHFGQGLDIRWHNQKNAKITEKSYLTMCAYKTGCLIRMAAKLGALLANANDTKVTKMGKIAEKIGIAFQIQDDILNISDNKLGKDFGDDIHEGKKTLMIIHTLNNATKKDKDELLKILDKKTNDKRLIKKAISIINKYNSITYAKNVAKKILVSARKDIDLIIKNKERKKELLDFADFLINRDH